MTRAMAAMAAIVALGKFHDVSVSGRLKTLDGEKQKVDPLKYEPGAKRNKPCVCGSGRKFKKCCRKTQGALP